MTLFLNFLRRRRDQQKSERGAIFVLSIVGVVLAVTAAGLSVDLGRLAEERRKDQKIADLAALDAVRRLPSSDATVDAAARESAERNGFDLAGPNHLVDAEIGSVDGDGNFTTLGDTAIEVTVRSLIDNAFMKGSWTVTVKAVATLGNAAGCALPDICIQPDGNPLGTVRVGSRFASLNGAEATILNRLLAQTVGGSYALDIVGYQGLAAGSVEFSRLRTALGIGAGQVDQLASSTFSYRQFLDAAVTALNAQGDSASTVAAGYLATIAAQVNTSAGAHFNVLELFDVAGTVGSGADVANAGINVLDFVRGGMILADADHFAEFNLLASSNDLPGLSGLLPNFVSARVKFGLIESPQMKSGAAKDASGNYRTIATTSQVRLLVELTQSISPVGIGLMNITVPYYIDAGSAQGKLDTLTCPPGDAVPSNVQINGVTSPASVNIGTVNNAALAGASAPTPGVAVLANVSLPLGITVSVSTTSVTAVNVSGKNALLTFTPTYQANGTPQVIPGTQLASVPTVGATNLSTTVRVGGLLSLGLNTNVTNAVVAAVTNAATPVLNTLLTPLMKSLGLTLGGADVWAPPPQMCNPTSFEVDPPPGTIVSLPTLIG